MKFIFRYILFFLCLSSFSQESGLHKVYLIGDAGEDTIPGKALLLLKEELIANPNSSVIFLGDNVYPSGLDIHDRNTLKRIESQLQILNQYKGQVYFIPGNHDWDAQKRNGQKTLKNQEAFIEAYLSESTTVSNRKGATFLPKDGLPGPETVLLDDNLRLIIIDTQWFLHFYQKNYQGSKKQTKELFYKRLDSLLSVSKTNGEQVIIAAHHPIYTNGQHGKRKQPFRFFVNCTPFQIFGLLGINRLYSQDISNPRYKKMRKQLLATIKKYDNVTYASGHDHNLQCFKEGGNRYIISGAGSKRSHLMKRNRFNSVFQDDKTTGFIKVEYSENKYKSTTIYRVGEQEFVLEGY